MTTSDLLAAIPEKSPFSANLLALRPLDCRLRLMMGSTRICFEAQFWRVVRRRIRHLRRWQTGFRIRKFGMQLLLMLGEEQFRESEMDENFADT